MRKLILPVFLISVGLFSCKKETTNLSDINKGNNFYPTQIGKYIIYNYDSTIWDDHEEKIFYYQGQLRYTTVDTFRDTENEGRLSYRIDVERRANETDPFEPSSVIYVTPSDNNVVMEERNVKFIKMVFPVSDGITWNGNAMIPIDDQDYAKEFGNDKWVYTYANFNTDYNTTPANVYNNTVTVNQIDDSLNNPDEDSAAYAYKNYAQEVYAYNVGMIYRKRTYWEFQPKIDGSGGSGFRKGYEVILKAVENN
jgi:hypothetical protein